VPIIYATYCELAMFALAFLGETRDIKLQDLDQPERDSALNQPCQTLPYGHDSPGMVSVTTEACMDESTVPNSVPKVGPYDANYGNFQNELYAQIRSEAFGEDIGQNSWLTSDEQDTFLNWLNLAPGMRLLDIACGAGGPALRIAEKTGCSVIGIDVHEQAISTAYSLSARRGFSSQAEFRVADATGPLPFPNSSLDAVTCIDGVNHLPNRPAVIAEWSRVLKPGGRLLFTDPVTVTGPLTNTEIAVRSSIGFFLFVPLGYDERLLSDCGLRLLFAKDATSNMAEVAQRRWAARHSRSAALRGIEGDQTYNGQQEFLAVASRIAREGRLSRFVYVSEKL
jgi:SAM-dependent methyltransferase